MDPDLESGINPSLTRRSLLRTALASGVTASVAGASPVAAFGRELQRLDDRPPIQPGNQDEQLGSLASFQEGPSLSQELAHWVADLRYEDLPAAVVDRAKGVSLQALASVLLGSESDRGQQAVDLITEEEAGVSNGATIMVHGTKATRGGAAFANAAMVNAGGKWDTFRMLTHPGTCIVPAALVAAEAEAASGEDFLAGLVAGYEVMERMAADVIPTMMTRGFHAGPVFGIFGATVAAGKIMGLTEDQMTNAIGLSVTPQVAVVFPSLAKFTQIFFIDVEPTDPMA